MSRRLGEGFLTGPNNQPDDWKERQKALDATRSCIVHAPAGSGKTELLVQRLLVLLAVAEHPEEILAITFTRKAAREMKTRLLEALESGGGPSSPADDHAAASRRRARKVLLRDDQLGWGLMSNPSRLQITTIDGFCAYLTRRMPWTSRFGDPPEVTEDPEELYQEASESLLAKLEQNYKKQGHLEQLLAHLDNRLGLLRDLLVAMLKRRDQWLRHLLGQNERLPRDLLEQGLDLYVSSQLDILSESFGEELCIEIWALSLFAYSNLGDDPNKLSILNLLKSPDRSRSLRAWQAFADLVLTANGDIRKRVTRKQGFPASAMQEDLMMKARMDQFLEHLRSRQELRDRLNKIRNLPDTYFSDAQWCILEALINLLPLAVVELQDIFRRKGSVDFIEIAGAARLALGNPMEPQDLLLQLDSQLKHILIDEFQDTSHGQFELLRSLTAGWQKNDGRTVFLVGDPMQSIYRFREAEVGLFLRVCSHGLDAIPMEHIVLKTNFRSSPELIDWVNAKFHRLFPSRADEMTGAVPFSSALPFKDSTAEADISVHCTVDRQDAVEAENVIDLIRRSIEENPEGRIAVLVRSRAHLGAIVKKLKQHGLRFQAKDVDPLTDRPVVQDLLSLIRALLHPADSVAWLSILRAPWCGLTLKDLSLVCSSEKNQTVWQQLTQHPQQKNLFENVSPDGQLRLNRIIPILTKALDLRGQISLRQLVESTWLALGGPACVDKAGLLDARQVFELLNEMGGDFSLHKLNRNLQKLFAAPDPLASPKLQLMTIHKAKGLEFDTVIIPGLGRTTRSRERELLRWVETSDFELLLAPIPPYISHQKEPIYECLGEIINQKDELETIRLLYVAVTRAKHKLHLLGHVKSRADGELQPLNGSLLSAAWPAVNEDFLSKAVPSEEEGTLERTRVLCRLPATWKVPPMSKLVLRPKRTATRASSYESKPNLKNFTRQAEEGKIIGTIVHFWLERIAREGVVNWDETMVRECIGTLKIQLNAQGVPHVRIDHCLAKITTCLINTLQSPRGRWLLKDHRDSTCEMPINGIVEGALVHAKVDRSFVDGDGVRWIVDYKTASPSVGESQENFIFDEQKRYEKQVRIYETLVRSLYPGNSIRSALYFPMFDGWIVLES
jgi:ATP-dependent exoDNAse (exonuclease V) beta subunit